MGSPYLNSNEAIVLSTHNVVINTVPAEAILTSQRLILVDARHAQLRPQDIPFASIETVTIGENSKMDPVLSLSILLPDETRHTLGIVFPQAPKQKRTGERDEWATKIRESGLDAQKDGGVKPAELLPPWVAGELPEEAGEGNAPVEPKDDGFVNPPLAPRKSRSKAPAGGSRNLMVAGVALVLIIACVAGVFFLAPSLFGNTGTAPAVTPTPTPVSNPTVTATPVVTTQPVVTVTPEPSLGSPEITPIVTTAPTPPVTQEVALPQSGVWIRIEYDGDYTASFGTAGRMKEIAASGEQYYQIPAKDQIVDAVVEKADATGGLLKVTIYSNGMPAKSGSTTSPRGTVELHADLRES